MAERRRGRTGRGWDAAPAHARSTAPASHVRRSTTGAASDPPPGDPAERAREICLRQLAVRPRTRLELAAALRRRGIADDVAAEVLERYSEVGIIDDRAFARAWVTSRHHGRGLARRALAGELRRKGIDAETAIGALSELDQEVEAQTARALVERKLRTDRGGAPEARFRRLVGMLARKGYPAGLAIRVVKEALRARDEVADIDEVFDGDLLDAQAREADDWEDEPRHHEP